MSSERPPCQALSLRLDQKAKQGERYAEPVLPGDSALILPTCPGLRLISQSTQLDSAKATLAKPTVARGERLL